VGDSPHAPPIPSGNHHTHSCSPGNACRQRFFSGPFFGGGALFSRMNSTVTCPELYHIWRGHRPPSSTLRILFYITAILLCFQTTVSQKRFGPKIKANFRTFTPKIRGGMGKASFSARQKVEQQNGKLSTYVERSTCYSTL